MAVERAFDRRGGLAMAALFVLALSLSIVAAATGWRRLSADWGTSCHRLLHVPALPGAPAPWRLTDRPVTPCPRPHA
jgi:hypothetical protein